MKEHIGKYLSIAKRFHSIMLDKKLKGLEMSSGQIFLLHALYKKEGVSQQELCDFYQIDKAAVGRSLKKLEKVELIVKETNNEDKRYHKLFLTEKGKKMIPLLREILDTCEKELQANLTSEEIELFFKVVKKICVNLGAKL